MAPESTFGNDGDKKPADTADMLEFAPIEGLDDNGKVELIQALQADLGNVRGQLNAANDAVAEANAQIAELQKGDDDKAARRRGGKNEGFVVKERQDRMVKVRHSTVVFRRDELITDPHKIALAREHGINLKRYVD